MIETEAAAVARTARALPRYPAYKDSGVAWLGEVPAQWEVKRADSVFREVRQQVEPRNLPVERVFHYSIPVIEETGDGQVETTDTIDSAKLEIHGGELIISKLNPRKSRCY